jgi:hypothetical protein
MVVFVFRHPFKSKLSTVASKQKTPFGVFAFCLIVELAGVEQHYVNRRIIAV